MSEVAIFTPVGERTVVQCQDQVGRQSLPLVLIRSQDASSGGLHSHISPVNSVRISDILNQNIRISDMLHQNIRILNILHQISEYQIFLIKISEYEIFLIKISDIRYSSSKYHLSEQSKKTKKGQNAI